MLIITNKKPSLNPRYEYELTPQDILREKELKYEAKCRGEEYIPTQKEPEEYDW